MKYHKLQSEGWNDVGFHGNNVISTPNIDALAYSGVILNNYYVQPLCTPSRSAFLTGMYPIHTGSATHFVIRAATPYGLPLNYTLFPHYLKRLGYSTKIVGKWHLGNFRKEYTPTFRDFDSHYGYWTGSKGTVYEAGSGSESVLPKMDGMNVWNSIQGNSPSPRNEFVPNINPILNLASVRVDDWKLLYNPIDLPVTDSNFNFWFGPSERDFPRNKYSCSKENDFKDVKNSLAGRTVQKLMPNIFKNIHKIRKNAEVLCTEVPENATATCNDPSNPCLFNIASDPCEYFDVSKSHPAIVKLLQNRLQFYNSTAIPPGNKPEDPRANPIFWNNTWTTGLIT
ncbi:Steryl-sulfatase [Armadillidium vulgare]|nr:Steryl-sulfatase [Armadillidium vulgare]